MTLSALDPNTALIVGDLQEGIVALPAIHPIADIVERVGALADAFRGRGMPVVLVNVAGGAPGRTEQSLRPLPRPDGWTDLIPELDRQSSDILVTNVSWGAFAGTDLGSRSETLGITQVVIAGVATGTGVEATARQAYEQGFNVTLAVDAMTDTRLETHDCSIEHVSHGSARPARAKISSICCQQGAPEMTWLPLVSHAFGGAFLANAFPHVVNGMTGRPFQSPFATPSGEGLSSPTVNVLWGFSNVAAGYFLVCRVGVFDLRSLADVAAFGAGALPMALFSARHFGRFHGGNQPKDP